MPRKSSLAQAISRLRTFDGETLNVVIETPQGSRNKFDFDEAAGLFKLGGVLPVGAVFPFDFGFAPQTLGEDGDPLDVLVLMDAPVFAGCWVPARLIGAVEAEQSEEENGKERIGRNDRLIAVAENSRNHKDISSLDQLNENLLSEIEHFFKSYNEMKGKEFRVVGHADAAQARKLVLAGMRNLSKANAALNKVKPRKSKAS